MFLHKHQEEHRSPVCQPTTLPLVVQEGLQTRFSSAAEEKVEVQREITQGNLQINFLSEINRLSCPAAGLKIECVVKCSKMDAV